jgi:phage terminase large subunit
MMLKASETGLIAASELALAGRDLTEEQYAQEFECSFDAAVIGSYYGKQLLRAELDKRIGNVPYETAAMVWTAWDLEHFQEKWKPVFRPKMRQTQQNESTFSFLGN